MVADAAGINADNGSMAKSELPNSRTRPVLVYDGDCGICTRCVSFVEQHLSQQIDIVAWQHADLAALKLSQAECEAAVQWVLPDGTVHSAHLAVAGLLRYSGGLWRVLGVVIALPLVRTIAAIVYRWIAANRDKLPGGTPACAMPAHLRPGASDAAPR